MKMNLFVTNVSEMNAAVLDSKRLHKITWKNMSVRTLAEREVPKSLSIPYRDTPGGQVVLFSFKLIKVTGTHAMYEFLG